MIQEVGLENLPNSYISLIELSELSPTTTSISVHCILKDVKKDGKFSWYKREELGKYLKLLIVVSTSPNISSELDNGTMPLDKMKISNHKNFDPTKVQFRQIKVGFDKNQILNDPEITPEGELYELEFGDKFQINSSGSDVKVYCATYIDIQQYSQDYRLDLTPSAISSYTGPVASESVFVNGVVSKGSFVFRTAQNAIWSGPVRLIGNEYYSGSKGRANPKEILQRIEVPNLKIKDYRKLKLVRTVPSKISSNLPIFGPVRKSYNSDGSLCTLFSIDLRALLLRNSKLARRLAIVDEGLLQNMIQNMKLGSIVVRKDKVITRPRISKSGTPVREKSKALYSRTIVDTKDRAPYDLFENNTKQAQFTEVVLSEDPNIRHFVMKDYSTHLMKGEFMYSLEVKLEDPTRKYVNSLAKEVETNLSSLKSYAVRSQLNKSQNKSRTRFNDVFKNIELASFGEEEQPWNTAAKLYVTYYNLFLNLSGDQTKELVSSAVARIHPSFATPLSVQYFLKEYSYLHQHFLKYFDARVKLISNIVGKGSKGKSSAENTIYARHQYKDVVIHEDKNNSVSYHDFKLDVFPTVSMKEFVSRTQEEKKKFFNSKPSLAGTNLQKLSKELAAKMEKQADSAISYLTPTKIIAGSETLDTKEPSSVDLDAFNKVFVKTKKQVTKEAVYPKAKLKKKIAIKSAKKIDAYINVKKDDKKTIEENLGKESKFRKADETYKPIITSAVVKKVKGKLKNFNKQEISSKQFAADSSKIKALAKNPDNLVLPPSLISVIASESRTSKNNTLTSKIDLVSSPETKDFFSIMYSNPAQVEAIVGYNKDSDGRNIYSEPIWKLIDTKDLESTTPLICRFKIFNTKHFDSQDLDLNIANEVFIILPDSDITKQFNTKEVVSMSNILNVINASERSKIEYQSNNLVKQSTEKDGPMQ